MVAVTPPLTPEWTPAPRASHYPWQGDRPAAAPSMFFTLICRRFLRQGPPLASVNCKGRAFRGGYLFCWCCCIVLYDGTPLRYTTAHWSWLITYAAGLFSVTIQLLLWILFCRNRNVIDFIHKFCSVTIVVAACRLICLSFCTVITYITLLSVELSIGIWITARFWIVQNC